MAKLLLGRLGFGHLESELDKLVNDFGPVAFDLRNATFELHIVVTDGGVVLAKSAKGVEDWMSIRIPTFNSLSTSVITSLGPAAAAAVS